MNIELYIIIGLSIILLIFIILFIISKIKLYKLYKRYTEDNKLFISTKSKLSIIEMYHRNYKEGMNPYTVLRDITNALNEEDIDEYIQKT